MNPLDWLHKQIAFYDYTERLPLLLLRDYGHVSPYTPGQVTATIERHRLSRAKYQPYVLALFCDPDDLEEPSPTARLAGARSFSALRQEVMAQPSRRSSGGGADVYAFGSGASPDDGGGDRGAFDSWSTACSDPGGSDGGDCGGGDGGGCGGD